MKRVDGKAVFTMQMPASGAGAALAQLDTNTNQIEKKSIDTVQLQVYGGPLVNLVPAGTHHSGYFSPSHIEQNRLQFNGQCLATSLQVDRHQMSPAISLSSINQPQHELSSTSSSDISQFRKLLRKVTYNIESTSNNQPDWSGDASQDGEVQSHPKDKVSLGTEIDIQLGLSMMPHSLSMKEKLPNEKKSINPELWQACAGPLVNLPVTGSHVVYFPQGHSEHVAACMKNDVDGQTPNYPKVPSKLLCLLHNVTLHADPETDEVYAQMTLQPVPSFDKDALLRSDLSTKANKPQIEFFCKTLTGSDTSTHGGFSVPRRAAEKIFPPLDFTMQPPAQELVARDLHDNIWTFRHVYDGQPKHHLFTTGWNLFLSGKRLSTGDLVLFIRDEKQQLLVGIRRAKRQRINLSSSVLSTHSMHIGIQVTAAHAAATNIPFAIFYNPWASPSEFVIPLAKYHKAVFFNQIYRGMQFRMLFDIGASGTISCMGSITGISDLDPVWWKNSHWRNLQVGWDESTAGEKRNRVSVWEIEPLTPPFSLAPLLQSVRLGLGLGPWTP